MPAARVYNSANISINDATLTALTFDTERTDDEAIHSTSTNTGRLTCVTAGVYVISGAVRFATNTTGNIRRAVIRLGGATIIAEKTVPPVGGSNYTAFTITTQYELAVGNYVELLVYQDSGGALNVEAAGNYSPEFAMAIVR